MTQTDGREILRLGFKGWTAILCLVVFTAALDLWHSYLSRSTLGLPWAWTTVAGVVICWVTYLALLPSALFFANRFRLDLGRSGRHFAIHIVAALAFAYFQCWTVVALTPSTQPTLSRFWRSTTFNFPCDVLSYWLIVGATYAFHFHSKSRERALEAARLEADLKRRELGAARLEASLTEARLQALQAQINPHFLFNTLNAISSLALTGNREVVAEMLARLGELLRAAFRSDSAHEISIADEMRLLDSYLEIQQLLLGDGLVVKRRVAPDVVDAAVPCMVLQPIVENAIVHGVGTRGPRRIAIEAFREGTMLCLQVSDNGPGFQPMPLRRGVGLANTQERLEQLYGTLHEIEYGRSPGGGAVVTLAFPFKRSTGSDPVPVRRVS
jgi:signal transduction histidine kinase